MYILITNKIFEIDIVKINHVYCEMDAFMDGLAN